MYSYKFIHFSIKCFFHQVGFCKYVINMSYGEYIPFQNQNEFFLFIFRI